MRIIASYLICGKYRIGKKFIAIYVSSMGIETKRARSHPFDHSRVELRMNIAFKCQPFYCQMYTLKGSFFQSLARSEATCKSQILTAQAVKDDVGDVVATQKGINLWSRCSLSNSERDVHRVTKKQKTTLDVPISHVTIEDVKVPWISPRDWLIWII